MAASDQRNFTVHMNMDSDDNKSSLRAARPAQAECKGPRLRGEVPDQITGKPREIELLFLMGVSL